MIDNPDHISRKIALYSIFGYFLSTTFSHALAQNLLGLAILSSLVYLFSQKYCIKDFRFTFFNVSIFLFIGWSIISSVFGSTPSKSLFIIKEEWLFLMIPIVGFSIRTKDELKKALMIFSVSVLVVGLYAIWQHWGGMDLYRGEELVPAPSGYRVIGFFSHRLTCGNYFAPVALMLLAIGMYINNSKIKYLFYGSFLAAAVTTAFTYSRGPILILGAGILAFLFTLSKKYARTLGIVVVILAIVIAVASPDIFQRYFNTFKTEIEGKYPGSRLAIARTASRMIGDHPLIGVGQGNFSDNYFVYRDENSTRQYAHAHNDILNIAAYAGIPAAVFFVLIWGAIISRNIRLMRQIKERSFIKGVSWGLLFYSGGFFITTLYEATFADEEVRMFLMAVWGLVIALEQIVKQDSKITERTERA